MITIQVNGEKWRAAKGTSAAHLLGRLKIPLKVCVVEINGAIIPRTELLQRKLQAGDRIEIIRFMAGGRGGYLDFTLYPVTCQKLSRGRSNFEVLEGLIAGGAKIVQLREKGLSCRELFEMASKFREITHKNGVRLIINDHLDIALAVKADGVHLGQDDLPCRTARGLAPYLIIGISAHTKEEALKAEADGASYVNLGPIFDTRTKGSLSKGLGVKFISETAPHLKIPFTVMGGINPENLDQVLKAGAKRIAVITALTEALDIESATRSFLSLIQ